MELVGETRHWLATRHRLVKFIDTIRHFEKRQSKDFDIIKYVNNLLR